MVRVFICVIEYVCEYMCPYVMAIIKCYLKGVTKKTMFKLMASERYKKGHY